MQRSDEAILYDYFNSRPSARGDLFQVFCIPTEEIFQFTPLREGRRYFEEERAARSVFQFTPLREGRRAAMADISAIGKISIHAPPRGATATSRKSEQHGAYFNSRPSARGDNVPVGLRLTARIFQFTPLREGRPMRTSLPGVRIDFNSRPSARGDPPVTPCQTA